MLTAKLNHQLSTLPAAQRGIGLIETLVTALILSVGLLGLAALQGRSLKATGDAFAMQMAVQHSSDYLERIRTNRSNASLYQMTNAKPACNAVVPLTNNVVTNDTALWLNAIACSLPQATATVTLTNSTRVTIKISWLDRLDSQTGDVVQQHLEISSEI